MEKWKAEAETQSVNEEINAETTSLFYAKKFKPMASKFHKHTEQQGRDMAVTGTGKREFQVMSVSSVANGDTGSVIVTETPHQHQQTSRTENGWGLSERDGDADEPNQLVKKEGGTVLFKCVDGSHSSFKCAFLLSEVCPSNMTSMN